MGLSCKFSLKPIHWEYGSFLTLTVRFFFGRSTVFWISNYQVKPIPFKGMGPKWAISTGKSMMNMNQSLSQGWGRIVKLRHDDMMLVNKTLQIKVCYLLPWWSFLIRFFHALVVQPILGNINHQSTIINHHQPLSTISQSILSSKCYFPNQPPTDLPGGLTRKVVFCRPPFIIQSLDCSDHDLGWWLGHPPC